jgi:hypothetical protein
MNIVNVKPNTNPLPSGSPEISRPSSEQPDAAKLLCDWEWVGETSLIEENSLLLPEVGSPESEKSESGDEGDSDASSEVFADDDIAHRRRYFQNKEHRMKPVFQPGFVYNFEVYSMPFNS